MSRKNNKNIKISFIVALIVLLIFLIILIAVFNLIKDAQDVVIEGTAQGNIEIDSGKDGNIVKNAESAELERLEAMTERARIEYYVTKFMNMIEAEEYKEAYSLLNDMYKQNYFATLGAFEQYAKSNFSKMMSIKYTNFERSGEVYVIWLTVEDAINGSPNSGKEMNFVVKEHGYNDFELSFSAN